MSNMKKLKMELRTETKLREIWTKILPWWVEFSKINETLNKLESKKGPYFEWDVLKKVHASVEDGLTFIQNHFSSLIVGKLDIIVEKYLEEVANKDTDQGAKKKKLGGLGKS